MKIIKLSSVLSSAIILFLLLTGIPAAPAAAAVGSITISTAAGPVGSALTVTGTGFTPGSTYTVNFDGAPIVNGSAVGGNVTATLTVPAAPAGGHAITVTTNAPDTSNPVTFNIVPQVLLSDTSMQVGDSYTVTGRGFAASVTVTVYIDGAAITSGPANASGTFTVSLTLQGGAGGLHTVTATDANANTASANYSVLPKVTVNPSLVSAGAQVNVSGNSFGTNVPLTIFIDGVTITSTSTDASGSFSTFVTIPPGAGGFHTLTATDNLGNTMSTTYSITASIAVNPGSAVVGGRITINGTAFGASSVVTVTVDGAVMTTTTSSATGAFNVSFTVPPGAAGSHTITASDTQGKTTTSTFNIIPAVTLSPASITAGAPVSVSGTGFAASATLGFYIDSVVVPAATATTNENGAFSLTGFALPPVAGGSHTLQVKDGNNNAATVTFTVTSSIAINPQFGAPGASIQITGNGFIAGKGISITFDNKAAVTSPPAFSADTKGNFVTSFTVPASSGGSHAVAVSDGVNSATASFSVTESANLNPAKGPIGTRVTVAGSGFISGSSIQVAYENSPVATATADNNGSFSASFNVPSSTAGAHTVTAADGTRKITFNFSITPGLVITPAAGYVGATITITGSGFVANSQAVLSYDSQEIPPGVSTDAFGSFSKAMTAPKSTGGTHVIRVVDSQKNTAEANFTMDTTPPPVPRLLSPGDGARIGVVGNVRPTFKWSAITDPSEVTYTLELDTTMEFSQPILRKTGLTVNQYILASGEVLPLGGYYWRVSAVDGASNQSDWASPQLLKAGLMPLPVLVIIIVLILAGGAAAIYYYVIRPGAKRRAALPGAIEAPEVVTGEWRLIQPEKIEGAEVKALPWRLALPESTRREKGLSTEDEARLKVIVDFARSLPLVSPDNTVDWLVAMGESQAEAGAAGAVYEQLLHGESQWRYEPAWVSHPLYRDLTALLEGQPILEDLKAFVGGVDSGAAEASALLRDIYRGSQAELPPDFLKKDGWEFISSIYADAVGWYLGKSLREPSQRDYVIKPDEAQPGTVAVWLSGETAAANRPILRALDEKQAAKLPALHLKLRREYRDSSQARRVAEIISQLAVRRNRLLGVLSQFGHNTE